MILRCSDSLALSHVRAFSGVPTWARSTMTASLAPPCSAPFSAAIPAVTAPCRSAIVDVTTRAAKVDALNPCSAYRISATSNAFTMSGCGTRPKVIQNTFSASDRSDRGGIGARPCRARASTATMVGIRASRSRVCRRCDSTSCATGTLRPRYDTAVRRTSIGWDPAGLCCSRNSRSSGSARLLRSTAWNAFSCARVGSSPYHSRYATSSNPQRSASSVTGYPRYVSVWVAGSMRDTAVLSAMTPSSPLRISGSIRFS